MAVLQRTPHLVENDATASLERIYPFEKFDRQVRQLDGWLKTGGLLVVHHSQYRFADASVSGRYRALEAKGQEIDRNVKFDRHSRRLALEYSVQMIFVKLGDESPASR
ncbi:MAG: hypothetical protein M3083_24895 [Actinomycetota bacterium]|nr:hypothetical protein [Actinomycetota bacterium]MDQ6945876.1 hypothetical protein [Actinomycetota bacterium]